MLGGTSVSPALRTSAREMLTERAGSAARVARRTRAKGETTSKGESESGEDTIARKTRHPRG
jgi:hypothetical protein